MFAQVSSRFRRWREAIFFLSNSVREHAGRLLNFRMVKLIVKDLGFGDGTYIFGTLTCPATIRELAQRGLGITRPEVVAFVQSLDATNGIKKLNTQVDAHFVDCGNSAQAGICKLLPFYPMAVHCVDGDCRPISNLSLYLDGRQDVEYITGFEAFETPSGTTPSGIGDVETA